MVDDVARGGSQIGKIVDDIPFINGWTKEKVLAEITQRKALDKVFDPSDYLDLNYIRTHLEKFNGKASYLMTKEQFDLFLKNAKQAGRPDGLYISTSEKIDEILLKAKGNIAVVEAELAIPIGSWQKKGGIVRIDINNPELFNLRMPTGAETGANQFFVPGGKTSGGILEAVTDPIPVSNITTTHVIIN